MEHYSSIVMVDSYLVADLRYEVIHTGNESFSLVAYDMHHQMYLYHASLYKEEIIGKFHLRISSIGMHGMIDKHMHSWLFDNADDAMKKIEKYTKTVCNNFRNEYETNRYKTKYEINNMLQSLIAVDNN